MKLLDAGRRLPVHVHPDVAFAREHLGLAHGKTEAWVFLEPGVEQHLGFERDVGADELACWVADQQVEAMLDAMHTDGNLGLGHATVLGAVDRAGRRFADIEQLRSASADDTGDLLPDAAPFFRAERTRGDTSWEAGYSVVVVTAGAGYLTSGNSDRVPLRGGDTVVVPYAARRVQA